jgi:hypothetical protein
MAQLSVTDVATLPVGEFLQRVYSELMVDIPEVVDPRDYSTTSDLLLKLPNRYAFVIELLGHSRYLVRTFKREKNQRAYEDMMDKRDGLADAASAIKLQYQAVSRALTAYEQVAEYGNMPEGKVGRP